MKPLLTLNKINFAIEEKKILQDISFEITPGEILGISGESGSGKTTLAKIMAGIIKPSGGIINFDTSVIKRFSVQLLFQNNGKILNPYRKIDDMLKETLLIHNTPKNELNKRVDELFGQTGIKSEIYSHRGYELSGGEQQRAALARLLAANPVLLILDEPFSAQDLISQANFISLIQKLNNEKNIAVICISHDLKALRKIADRIMILYKGKIAECRNTEELFSNPQHHYTKFLLNSENYNLTYEEIQNILGKVAD